MATELLSNTLDPLPRRASEDCGGNRKKISFRGQDREEGNAMETSKVAGGGTGGEDMDSGGAPDWDVCFDQNDARGR